MSWPYSDIVPDNGYPSDTLYADVIKQIVRDLNSGDTSAIEGLLDAVSTEDLQHFLSEV